MYKKLRFDMLHEKIPTLEDVGIFSLWEEENTL